MERFFLNRK